MNPSYLLLTKTAFDSTKDNLPYKVTRLRFLYLYPQVWRDQNSTPLSPKTQKFLNQALFFLTQLDLLNTDFPICTSTVVYPEETGWTDEEGEEEHELEYSVNLNPFTNPRIFWRPFKQGLTKTFHHWIEALMGDSITQVWGDHDEPDPDLWDWLKTRETQRASPQDTLMMNQALEYMREITPPNLRTNL